MGEIPKKKKRYLLPAIYSGGGDEGGTGRRDTKGDLRLRENRSLQVNPSGSFRKGIKNLGSVKTHPTGHPHRLSTTRQSEIQTLGPAIATTIVQGGCKGKERVSIQKSFKHRRVKGNTQAKEKGYRKA